MPDVAQTVPLFGFGYGTKSPNASAQLRTNCYVEKLDDPDKGQLVVYGRPGLKKFARADVAHGGDDSAIRGIVCDALSSGGTKVMFVQKNQLFTLDSSGTLTAGGVGVITTTSGVVRAAEIDVVGSSYSGLYIDGAHGYTFSVDAPGTTFEISSFPNAGAFPATTPSICAIASRIVAVDPAYSGRFRWSAAGDVTSWASLDFATAESSPDPLSAVFEMAGQLLLIGTQTIEFWSPTATGAANQQPFQRVGGANIQWGTTSIDTIRKCNDSVIFLGRNQGGNRQVVQLKGYEAQVISTPDIEHDIALLDRDSMSAVDASTAFFAVVDGHSFYVLTVNGTTFAYDVRTQTWARWTTDSGAFAGKWCCPAFGQLLVTDRRDGRIHALDADRYIDDDKPIARSVTSKHAWANLARLSLRELRIDTQPGTMQRTNSDAVFGTATISLAWSKDGGNSFGTPVACDLGTFGAFRTAAVWRNLGRSRDWVFTVSSSDQWKFVVVGAAAVFQP